MVDVLNTGRQVFSKGHEKISGFLFGKTESNAVGVQQYELLDAAKGILYWLGNLEVEFSNPKSASSVVEGALGSFGADLTSVKDLAKVCSNGLEKSAKLVEQHVGIPQGAKDLARNVGEVNRKREKLMAPLADFVRKHQESLSKRYSDELLAGAWVAEYLAFSAASLTKTLTDAIPGWAYVTAADSIYGGVKKSFFSILSAAKFFYEGYGVDVLNGHPSIITKAMGRHLGTAIAQGFLSTAVSATKLGLTAAGDAFSGVGSVFSAVVGAVQRLVALVETFIQRVLIERALKKATTQWSLRPHEDGSGGSPGYLGGDAEAFAKWFRMLVVGTPVLGALVMRSNLAANPVRFLRLLDSSTSGSEPTKREQDKFDKGEKYIAKLKSRSADYLKGYMDEHGVKFTGKDELAKSIVTNLTNKKIVIPSSTVL